MSFTNQKERKAYFATQKDKMNGGFNNNVVEKDQSQTQKNLISGQPDKFMSNPMKQVRFPKLRKKLLGL